MEENNVPFEIIAYAGDAMNKIMEAMDCLANKDVDQADNKVKEAEIFITKAHKNQTDLIFKECNGEKTEMSLIMVHAQDHLMNAMLAKQFVQKMITIFRNY